jgi:16S rRNA processing protein RimM
MSGITLWLWACLAASFLVESSHGLSGPRAFNSPFSKQVVTLKAKVPFCFLLKAISTGSSADQQPQRQEKRKKKNKYAEYSNTDALDRDPLEALIAESQEKLSQLEQEQSQSQKHKQSLNNHVVGAIATASRIDFPDAKTAGFDPYNPVTFGFVEIGQILGPHGVHGWVKVKGYTDFPERLTQSGMLLHVKPLNKRAPRRVTLASGKIIGTDSFLIQLQDCYSRGDAENLKGATIFYATQQDPVSHEEDEFLVSDLVGLQVFLQEDKNYLVGTVQAIVLAEEMCSIPGLGHDMLEVVIAAHSQGPNKLDDLVLIPLVPEIVPKVDLAGRIIFIDPPTGLLDLRYVREEKVRIKGLLAPAKTELRKPI